LILVLPPTFEFSELEAATPHLLNALHKNLVAAGYRAALLDRSNHDLVWQQEVDAVGGIVDPVSREPRQAAFDLAIRTLVARVSRETGATMVLRPRLVLREAQMSGTKASWDGQTRWIPATGIGGGTAHFSGSTSAVSVQLVGFQSSGQFAFLAYGGVSLPFRTNFNTRASEFRNDLFSSPTEVMEGTAIALRPLLDQTVRKPAQ
jgi:hypothetical protein